MNATFFTMLFTILGLSLFEIISSVDNAIINAEVLSTMRPKSRRWFLLWGLLFSVVLIRGILPWLILWVTTPQLGPIDAIIATFSNDSKVLRSVEESSPILFMGGGVFLIFLFFHWLFLETKNFGIRGERFFYSQGVWFYAVVSVLLTTLVWFALKLNPFIAFSAVVGSTAFFIIHGFKQQAELQEKQLLEKERSDLSKILFLEVIDATFSIDGVLGAFAFTLSVPLILLGNGLGSVILRQLTVSNIHRIRKYRYLKNGAMYSIFFLGMIMVLDSFGYDIPGWFSPFITFFVVGYFFLKSKLELPEETTT